VYDSWLRSKRTIAPITAELDSATSARSTEDEDILSLGEILRAAWRRLWVVIVIVELSVGVSVAYTLMQTPMYESSIKVLVGQDGGVIQNPQLVQNFQQLTKTMSDAINSRPTAEGVVEQLDLDMSPEELLGRLRVEQAADTQFIKVFYSDQSPERAQQIINAFGDVFSEEISEANPNVSGLTAKVWERAQTPDTAISPRPVRNVLVGLVVGLALGIVLAVLLESLNKRVSSSQEVAQISGVPTLGTIPEAIPNSNKNGK